MASIRTNRNATAAEYRASLRKIYTVSTVQGFWSVYDHIPDVRELQPRSYYHVMRGEDRQPLWEDPSLSAGGVWRIKCHKKDTVSALAVGLRAIVQCWFSLASGEISC